MNGLTLYEGPSRLGKDDIVVLATGLTRPSVNRKTGDVVQVYILLKDWHPALGRQNGRDESICGTCVMRQGSWNQQAECYVKGYMLNQPWTSWRWNRALYPKGSLQDIPYRKTIRVGAYGDMAAVPECVPFWEAQLRGHQWLAYTSQWSITSLQHLAMASVHSHAEQRTAAALGYRTYRRYTGQADPHSSEIECPFPRVQCNTCGLCDGNTGIKGDRKHIIVQDVDEKRKELSTD